MLAESLYKNHSNTFAHGWNFGPKTASFVTVKEIVDLVINNWGSGSWELANEVDSPKETKELYLDSSLANNELNWEPVWDIEKSVSKTIEWYKNN